MLTHLPILCNALLLAIFCYTTFTVFDALGSSEDADLIMELYRELRLRANIEDKRLKLKPDSHTCANLVKALTACGRSSQALTVFDTMRQENVPLGMCIHVCMHDHLSLMMILLGCWCTTVQQHYSIVASQYRAAIQVLTVLHICLHEQLHACTVVLGRAV
jgi:pentatricopeptide repeat protein